MWTDQDRKQKRTYLIFVGRKLAKKMICDLHEATDAYMQISIENLGKRTALYHDKRHIDNRCAWGN